MELIYDLIIINLRFDNNKDGMRRKLKERGSEVGCVVYVTSRLTRQHKV